MEAVVADLRNAIRQWRRVPLITAIALMSLTLGLGATIALFALVDAVYLRPLPVREPQSLVKLGFHRLDGAGLGGDAVFSTALWERIRDAQPVLHSVSAAASARVNLSRGGESRFAQVLYVSGRFFDLVGVPISLGRPLMPSDDTAGAPAVAVIDHAFWKRELEGRPNIIGTSIALEGHPVEIVGVTASSFFGLEVGRRTQVYVPIAQNAAIHGRASDAVQVDAAWLLIVGRLRRGQSVDQATAAFRAWQPGLRDAVKAAGSREDLAGNFDIESIAYGISPLRRELGRPLVVLLAGVVIVLVMACANLAGLMSARFMDRRVELWTRRALGASPGQLVRSLVTEALMLSGAGVLLGIGLASWLVQIVMPSLVPPDDVRIQPYLSVHLDWRLAGVATLLALVSGLAAGLPAALFATHGTAVTRPPAAGVDGFRAGGSPRLTMALVTAQVALSLILVSSAGVFVRSFLKLTLQPTALDLDRVLLASLAGPVFEPTPAATVSRLETLTRRLEALPRVSAVSISTVTPLSGLIILSRIEVPGYVSRDPRTAAVAVNRVSPRFFEVFGTPLEAGRVFDGRDGADAPRVAIVNQAFQHRYFQDRDVIGRTVGLGGSSLQIVGVVATAKYLALREATMCVVYVPLAQRLTADPQPLRIGIRSEVPTQLRGSVLAELRRFDPRLTVEFRTLYDEVASSVSREHTLAWSAGLLGALALLMGAMGLYGAFSTMVTRRNAEIAIRMALGADRLAIVWVVLRVAATVVFVGGALGGLAVALSGRLVDSLAFDISSRDPWMFAGALAVVVLMAAGATLAPIRRAARVDPMVTLRAQ